MKQSTYPNLSCLVRLVMLVQASAISQELQFSELKRRCSGLRNRINVDLRQGFGRVLVDELQVIVDKYSVAHIK